MPDDKLNEKVGPGKNGGGDLGKYKWWIVGGLAVVAILVFYFVNRNNQANASTTAGNPGVAGGSGAYGFGVPGPQGGVGPAGPRGGRGPRGPRGPGGTTKHTHRQASVPRVIGFPYPAAAAVLRADGFRPRRSEKFVGVVRNQSPDAGDKVDRGTTVTLGGADKKKAPKHPTNATHPFMQNANAVKAHNSHATHNQHTYARR